MDIIVAVTVERLEFDKDSSERQHRPESDSSRGGRQCLHLEQHQPSGGATTDASDLADRRSLSSALVAVAVLVLVAGVHNRRRRRLQRRRRPTARHHRMISPDVGQET